MSELLPGMMSEDSAVQNIKKARLKNFGKANKNIELNIEKRIPALEGAAPEREAHPCQTGLRVRGKGLSF